MVMYIHTSRISWHVLYLYFFGDISYGLEVSDCFRFSIAELLFHVHCVTNGTFIMYLFIMNPLSGDQAAEILVTSLRLPDHQDCSAYAGHEIFKSYVI
jgi:hypothetical protein